MIYYFLVPHDNNPFLLHLWICPAQSTILLVAHDALLTFPVI